MSRNLKNFDLFRKINDEAIRNKTSVGAIFTILSVVTFIALLLNSWFYPQPVEQSIRILRQQYPDSLEVHFDLLLHTASCDSIFVVMQSQTKPTPIVIDSLLTMTPVADSFLSSLFSGFGLPGNSHPGAGAHKMGCRITGDLKLDTIGGLEMHIMQRQLSEKGVNLVQTKHAFNFLYFTNTGAASSIAAGFETFWESIFGSDDSDVDAFARDDLMDSLTGVRSESCSEELNESHSYFIQLVPTLHAGSDVIQHWQYTHTSHCDPSGRNHVLKIRFNFDASIGLQQKADFESESFTMRLVHVFAVVGGYWRLVGMLSGLVLLISNWLFPVQIPVSPLAKVTPAMFMAATHHRND